MRNATLQTALALAGRGDWQVVWYYYTTQHPDRSKVMKAYIYWRMYRDATA